MMDDFLEFFAGGPEIFSRAAFSPPDIAGLQLWLKAYEITGLSDGDPVTTWEDSHTSNNDFTQATAAKKPTYQTNEINGLAVVRFDGTDDILTAANFLSATAGTVFAVVRLTSAITYDKYIIGSADEAGAGSSYWGLSPADAAGFPFSKIQTRISGGTANVIDGSTTISAAAVYLMMWRSTDTAYTLRVDGNEETVTARSGADNGVWLGDVPGRDNFTLGALKWNAEYGYLKGDLGELVMYDTALSAGNISSVETYLNGRWAAF